jgi:hypothetical protein
VEIPLSADGKIQRAYVYKSTGGFTNLLVYMNSKYDINTFSARASISNMVDWYHESEGRKKKYAKHISQPRPA